MKLMMIMAGGTGGHVYPALAIAKQLQQNDIRVIWLGTREGLEARVVPEHGIEIEWIEISGVVGTGISRWFKLPLQLIRAIMQALAIFKRRQPDALLSMGGFVAGPGGLAGWLKRIPLVLHEANAVAGLTNKVLALMAEKIMCAFPNTKGLPNEAQLVGNPVREEIVQLHDDVKTVSKAPEKLNLLIIGGSQGAISFNEIIPQAIKLIDDTQKPRIVHQTGRGRSAGVKENYLSAGVEAEVHEYLEDMAQQYAWADLIICRSGAMTVAEITTVGLPALVVPYPYAAGDHQYFNAQFLEQNHAARILLHDDFTAANLAQALSGLLTDKQGLAEMAENSRKLAITDATQKAAQICEQVLYA